jgi:hypothetical protein
VWGGGGTVCMEGGEELERLSRVGLLCGGGLGHRFERLNCQGGEA